MLGISKAYTGYFEDARTALLGGAGSPPFACEDEFGGEFVVRYCDDYHAPSRQYVHALANYPESNEIQCDSAGNVHIGPPDGADYFLGYPVGIPLFEGGAGARSIRFQVLKPQLDAWQKGPVGKMNTLQGILTGMIDQALVWLEQGTRGLCFDEAKLPSWRPGKYIEDMNFKFKEFAWWPIGKIAYMITSLFRTSHVARDDQGRIVDFYAANCMSDTARETAIVNDFASGAARSKAVAEVTKLINAFNQRYTTERWETSPANSYVSLPSFKERALQPFSLSAFRRRAKGGQVDVAWFQRAFDARPSWRVRVVSLTHNLGLDVTTHTHYFC